MDIEQTFGSRKDCVGFFFRFFWEKSPKANYFPGQSCELSQTTWKTHKSAETSDIFRKQMKYNRVVQVQNSFRDVRMETIFGSSACIIFSYRVSKLSCIIIKKITRKPFNPKLVDISNINGKKYFKTIL